MLLALVAGQLYTSLPANAEHAGPILEITNILKLAPSNVAEIASAFGGKSGRQ